MWGTDRIRVVVAGDMPLDVQNAAVHLVSATANLSTEELERLLAERRAADAKTAGAKKPSKSGGPKPKRRTK